METTMLAVDLGAGSGRVMAGTLGDGLWTLRELHRFTSPPRPIDGLLRWDLDHLEAEVRRGVALVGPEVPVASLGIDGWGVDFVLLDDRGTEVESPRCYRNEHTRAFVEPVLERLGEARVYGSTGIQTLHFNTLFQLAAWKASGFPDRAARFAMVPDALAARLGAPLVNEVTNASTTQLLDARTRDWDRSLVADLGLPDRWFTRPVPPGTVLSEGVSLGTHRPALVAPATHDTGSAVAALSLAGPGDAYIATGTWCLVGLESPVPETSEAARAANFTNEAGVGTYRFLKNCMGLWLVQQLRASWPGCPDFGPLADQAASAPAFQALVDADDPRFFQPGSMKQALEQWWDETGQSRPRGPAGYARACVEGLALAFRAILRNIEALRGVRLERLHLAGGGSRNALLCQLTADATGLTVLAGPVEASTLGNLAVQAQALGLVANLAEARRQFSRSFPPVEYHPRGNPQDWERAAARLAELKEQRTQKGDRP